MRRTSNVGNDSMEMKWKVSGMAECGNGADLGKREKSKRRDGNRGLSPDMQSDQTRVDEEREFSLCDPSVASASSEAESVWVLRVQGELGHVEPLDVLPCDRVV